MFNHSITSLISHYIPYFKPKFIWINYRIVGEAEGGPSTNHSHLPRASGQLPNISLPPSFPLRFSSSLWLLPHFSFLLLLLSAFLGWIRLLVLKTLGAQHSLPATSIPLEPDHPFHLFFLTWRTSCQTILVNPCFWAFDDYRKGPVSFFFLPLTSTRLLWDTRRLSYTRSKR